MLLFTCLKIRSCIEYQMKKCKNFKNFKFSRKLHPMLIPFIVLNKIQHAYGKSDDNQYSWHATSVKSKRDIGEKRKLGGNLQRLHSSLPFWSCFEAEFLLLMFPSPLHLNL